MAKTEIYNKMVKILDELFEIDPSTINLDSDLYEDLELDSIDAIDLVVKIQDIADTKLKPDEFKSARTVSDVLDIISKRIS